MTTTVAIPAPSDAVVESEQQGRSILAKLPDGWAEPVAFFAMSKLYLLRTRGPLVTNLRYWIAKGLTLDDAKAIFRRLCDPEMAQNHNFENQLMADMAALVARVLHRRRMLEDMAKRREAAAADAAMGEVVRLADVFKMPFKPAQE